MRRSTPSDSSSWAARSSPVLWEPLRRLPLIPRREMSATDVREVRADRDLVADREAALGQRGVPVQAVLGAVEGAGQVEADPLGVAEADDGAEDAAAQLDGPGVALQGELADDPDLVPAAGDL